MRGLLLLLATLLLLSSANQIVESIGCFDFLNLTTTHSVYNSCPISTIPLPPVTPVSDPVCTESGCRFVQNQAIEMHFQNEDALLPRNFSLALWTFYMTNKNGVDLEFVFDDGESWVGGSFKIKQYSNYRASTLEPQYQWLFVFFGNQDGAFTEGKAVNPGGQIMSLVFSGSQNQLPVRKIILGNTNLYNQASFQVFRSLTIFKGIARYDPDIINFLTVDTTLNFLNYYGKNWSDNIVMEFEVAGNRGINGQKIITNTATQAVLGQTALSQESDPTTVAEGLKFDRKRIIKVMPEQIPASFTLEMWIKISDYGVLIKILEIIGPTQQITFQFKTYLSAMVVNSETVSWTRTFDSRGSNCCWDLFTFSWLSYDESSSLFYLFIDDIFLNSREMPYSLIGSNYSYLQLGSTFSGIMHSVKMTTLVKGSNMFRGYYLQSGECSELSQFFNSQFCDNCDSECVTCYKEDANTCQSCETPYLLQNGECKGSCSLSYFKTNKGFCYPCHSTCETCSDTRSTSCITCPDERLYEYGRCVLSCSTGYYQEFSRCLKCNPQCKNCSGPQDNKCTECHTDFFLHNSECKNKCPDNNYVTEDRSCQRCHLSCGTCRPSQSADACLTCTQNSYLLDGKRCVTACPFHYSADTASRTCVKIVEKKANIVLATVIPSVTIVLILATIVIVRYCRYKKKKKQAKEEPKKPLKTRKVFPQRADLPNDEKLDCSDIVTSQRNLRPQTRDSNNSQERQRFPSPLNNSYRLQNNSRN